MLRMSEYKDIQEQFNKVILYSQGYDFEINTDSLFAQWNRNKNRLRAFTPFFPNGELIYEYPEPVSFGLNDEAKQERLARFVRELWDYPYLQEFLRDNQDNFFTNIVKEDYQAPHGTARKGMKLIKAFKFFFQSDAEEELKILRDEASAIMNQDKIEGYFCISIHPLDYISISDNACKWHTCHSMDSDYRAGNLNYMADGTTVVCYVRSRDKDCHIDNFPEDVPWNSKKWRALLFFDAESNFVMAGKQYPLQSDATLDFFQTAYCHAKKLDTMEFGPWETTQVKTVYTDEPYDLTFPMIPVGSELLPVHKLYVPKDNTYQYNDILKNSKYRSHVKYAYLCSKDTWCQSLTGGKTYPNGLKLVKYLFTDQPHTIHVGEEVDCPHCRVNKLNMSNELLCDQCAIKLLEPEELDEEWFPTCDRCGERFIHYQGVWDGERHLCLTCYNYNHAKDYEDEKEKDNLWQ